MSDTLEGVLTDEDRATLNLLREQKAAADLDATRKKRLNEFVNGELTKDYAKEVLASGLQADLEAMPSLLDSTETFSYAAKKALEKLTASMNTKTETTPQPEPTQTSAPLTPQATSPAAQNTQQDTAKFDIEGLSVGELVAKHGFTMAQAATAKAFKPRTSQTN